MLDYNPIVLKIENGTERSTGPSLCKSCKYSMIFSDSRGEQTACSQLYNHGGSRAIVRGRVSSCNKYFHAAQPSIYELEAIAWELKTRGSVVGFNPPKPDKF